MRDSKSVIVQYTVLFNVLENNRNIIGQGGKSMAENNFYELLGLSVEHFENNPAKLTPILEKYILDGKAASPSNKKYKIVAIYESAMREAVRNPKKWEELYVQYFNKVKKEVLFALILASEEKTIDIEKFNLVCNLYKVSQNFAKGILEENAIVICDYSSTTLEIYEQDKTIHAQLSAIQSLVEELEFSTLAELIQSELNTNINLSTVSNDTIQEAMKHIKEKWAKKIATPKRRISSKYVLV